MKATELSVGDIVLIDGKPTRIDAVHLRKVGWHSRKDRLTWTRIDKVQPMPVTADLLRWNSFREGKLIHGWFRRTFEGAKTVSVCIHEILGKAVSYDFWVEQPFDYDNRQTKACRVWREMGDLMILNREQLHRSMADVEGLHLLQRAMNEADIKMEWGTDGFEIPEEQQPIDVPLDMVTYPEQSWRLITSGMPKDSADMKAVPCDPSGIGMPKEAFSVIMSNPGDFDPMANRPFGCAYIAWTLQRMIEILPQRINLQLEYDLDRYIYRHGDTYVVKYESHVQIVEYRKQSLAEALVEMLRYLLRYDFTKQQLNLKAED